MLTCEEMATWTHDAIMALTEQEAIKLGFIQHLDQIARYYTLKTETSGYVSIYIPHNDPWIGLCKAKDKGKYGRRVFYHRYVYSKYIGRLLTSEEQVHHKDRNKQNCKVDNLEMWLLGHPAGQSLIDFLDGLPAELIAQSLSRTKHASLLK